MRVGFVTLERVGTYTRTDGERGAQLASGVIKTMQNITHQ